MKIGIDISQMVYEKTGVANYLRNLLENLLKLDKKNEYILFASSLRQRDKLNYYHTTVRGNSTLKIFPFPPTFLDFLWNRLHICPIEWFIGDVDIFITSDWTEPPAKKAKKATILYDLIVYKYPEETAQKIVEVQKRKLAWVKKESDVIFCISQATKKDAMEILGIEEERLRVVYLGG
jgi:glycosyltransferase involved in cell wall biosynthesis